MRYYMPLLSGERDPRSITYSLSTERKVVSPWPKDRWGTTYGLMYMVTSETGLLNEETKREMPRLTALIRPNVEELPDIIGQFGNASTTPPPLINEKLQALVEELSPGCCEYLDGPEIWDLVFEREIDRTNYKFANVIKQADTWDHNLSDIRAHTRRDGSVYSALNGMGTVDPKKARGLNLWRDSVTRHVLCSEEFKVRAEQAEISNFFFFEQYTTAPKG